MKENTKKRKGTKKQKITKKNARKMTEEKWESLTLGNSFIFSKVMLNEELCKKTIQELLDIPLIDYIEYIDVEKTIDIRIDSKSVRLDVYIKDDKGTFFNLEMQVRDTKELSQRARYYQSITDLDMLEKGQEYDEIADSYIIFLCREDVFKRGLYRYTFENTCQEMPDVKLDDGVRKVFLNTKGTIGQLSEDAKGLLDYIEGKKSENTFVGQLEAEVAVVKSNKKWRAEYVKQYANDRVKFKEGKAEGIAEGRIEGKAEGREEGIGKTIRIMRALTINDDVIAEKIKEEFELSDEDVQEFFTKATKG